MNDIHYMEMALDLARQGEGFTSPNPMVGAVVVKDGKIVGTGYHEGAGQPHAEVNAIDDAGKLADGATLYVTLEPCNHTGRTPPCTRKILETGIRRVVMAMADPNPDVIGGGAEFLKQQGVEITTGIGKNRASKLNEAFIKFVQTKRPFVIVKCAATLDGRIATRTGDSKWVTGEMAREHVHRLRHAVDAIMIGINTVQTDNPSLTTRLKHGEGRDPVRIILDTRLRISPDAKVLRQDSTSETIVVTGTLDNPAKKTILDELNVRVIESPLKNGIVDLNELMACLGSMGIISLLIEGGSRVLASAFCSGIVDKIFFFYAPKILGGDDGVPICSGPSPKLMDQAIGIKDVTVHRFGDDVMIEGYIR